LECCSVGGRKLGLKRGTELEAFTTENIFSYNRSINKAMHIVRSMYSILVSMDNSRTNKMNKTKRNRKKR
jgi:hypothetical protein